MRPGHTGSLDAVLIVRSVAGGAFAYLIGKRALPLVEGVLVDQRGARAAVAHAFHQFAEARALVGEGVPGMAQVVEMDAGQADRGALSRSIREVKSHQRETVLEAQGYVRDEGAAAEGAAAEPDDIIAYCGERLSACKYAREVRITADLPKGQTGKILKRELRPE